MVSAQTDLVFRALADPTRRSVLEQIMRAERSVVELTRDSSVTQGAISQHLKQLKQAGLVVERPEGRKVFYRARPEGLTPIFDWLRHYEDFWHERFADLNALLKEIDP
jgi:DNA-binding transcriptional ArsR family regulator